MKVRRRTIPLDMFSAESKERTVTVYSHRHTVIVHVYGKDGQSRAYREFTFDQFCNLFEGLRGGIEEILTR